MDEYTYKTQLFERKIGLLQKIRFDAGGKLFNDLTPAYPDLSFCQRNKKDNDSYSVVSHSSMGFIRIRRRQQCRPIISHKTRISACSGKCGAPATLQTKYLFPARTGVFHFPPRTGFKYQAMLSEALSGTEALRFKTLFLSTVSPPP